VDGGALGASGRARFGAAVGLTHKLIGKYHSASSVGIWG